uniref:Uncharacterized protein n=1 Tax=Sinocyclocheilus rhinocerous TaxID=307959 RepID=A0A673J0V5_9TELE
MGNLISRPSCLGQKSKKVKSDESVLKERYQQRREWPLPEPPKEETRKEDLEEVLRQTPTPDKQRSSPAPTVTTTSTLDNAWRSTPQYGSVDTRASLQRRDSGSPWSWKPPNTREVTEVTEVTETIVTEIVEVTEYPPAGKVGDPIVTRTVRVLTGAAEELAEHIVWSYVKDGRSVLALNDEFRDPLKFLQNLEMLLTWVCEIEELTANQKPPSSEFKVVKAQLQEQKEVFMTTLHHRSSTLLMRTHCPAEFS